MPAWLATRSADPRSDHKRALAAGFLSWLQSHTDAQDVEDLASAATALTACRYHAAKLVTVDRIPDANALRIFSPADFLKFVIAGPKPHAN